jgi:hypothetical protein
LATSLSLRFLFDIAVLAKHYKLMKGIAAIVVFKEMDGIIAMDLKSV